MTKIPNIIGYLLIGIGMVLLLITLSEFSNATKINYYTPVNKTQFENNLGNFNVKGVVLINIYPCSHYPNIYGRWLPITKNTSKIYLYYCGDDKQLNLTIAHELHHHFYNINFPKEYRENVNHKGRFWNISVVKQPIVNNNISFVPKFQIMERF